jgi:branched-chain amino acid transport system substrate-binding protein
MEHIERRNELRAALRPWAWMAGPLLLCSSLASGADNIVLGQSLSLTGSGAAKARAERIVEGTQAYINGVNRAGGIHGRQVAFQTLDDAGSSGTAKANVEKLAANSEVVALLNMAGGGTCVGVIPVVQASQLPMVGCMAGSPQLRSQLHSHIFNIRPGHDMEYEAMAQQAASVGMKSGVFVHDDTETGRLHLADARKALERRNLKLIGHHAISKDTKVSTVAADILASKPHFVFNQGPNDFFAELIAQARDAGASATFMSVSSGADTVVGMLKEKSRGVMFTQVVPFPFVPDVRKPVITQYRRDLAASFPGSEPTYDSFESYINARVMVEALRKAGPKLSRESLRAALETFGNLDVGGFAVQFGKDRHTGSSYTEIVIATNTSRRFMK